MKTYLYKILLFSLPILLLIIFTEQQYKRIPNDYKYKSDYLKKYGNQIEVLILGGSHNYRGINPDYFDLNCFNAAMVSQTLNYDLFILEQNINHLLNLQYVIIPISYPTLTSTLEETLEHWRKYRYIHYMGYDKLSLNDHFSINRYLAISQHTGISVIRQLFRYWLLGEDLRDCQQNGWGKSPSGPIKNLEILAKKAAQRHEDHSFEITRNLTFLNKIIELCREHDIKLILITTPATPYYIYHTNEKKWNLIAHACDSIASHHFHVRYLNMLYDTSYVDSLFLDGDHLNSQGAQILTLKLNETINQFSTQMATRDSSIHQNDIHSSSPSN